MNFRKKIDRWLSWVLIIIMSLMVINVLWQVFTRYIVGTPSSFTDELARYLMIWLGILGAAYVSGQKMHVAIDILATRSGIKTRKRLGFTVNILITLFAITGLVIGGIRLVVITYILDQHSPALQLPLAALYLVLPISGMFIIYYKVSDLLNPKV